MVVEKVLVVGGIMLVGYGVYAFTCRLRRRWHCVGGPEEVICSPVSIVTCNTSTPLMWQLFSLAVVLNVFCF